MKIQISVLMCLSLLVPTAALALRDETGLADAGAQLHKAVKKDVAIQMTLAADTAFKPRAWHCSNRVASTADGSGHEFLLQETTPGAFKLLYVHTPGYGALPNDTAAQATTTVLGENLTCRFSKKDEKILTCANEPNQDYSNWIRFSTQMETVKFVEEFGPTVGADAIKTAVRIGVMSPQLGRQKFLLTEINGSRVPYVNLHWNINLPPNFVHGACGFVP